MHFTIRELALVTVIVAMGVAWAIDHHIQTTNNANEWQDALNKNMHLFRELEKCRDELRILRAARPNGSANSAISN